VSEAYRMLPLWAEPSPFEALSLLDAKYASPVVRAYAVKRLHELDDRALSDFLLQLTQVLCSLSSALLCCLANQALSARKTRCSNTRPTITHRWPSSFSRVPFSTSTRSATPSSGSSRQISPSFSLLSPLSPLSASGCYPVLMLVLSVGAAQPNDRVALFAAGGGLPAWLWSPQTGAGEADQGPQPARQGGHACQGGAFGRQEEGATPPPACACVRGEAPTVQD